jgi:diacylglycerol kinase (ATP)
LSQPASGPTTETDAAAEQHASPRQESDGAPPARGRSLPGGVVLVVNPTKVGDLDELTDLIAAGCAPLGLPAPQVLATSKEDPGKGQAEQAVRSGAALVIAAGGDGTVRAVAEALVGTGVRLGVVPLGTGNLLARNLSLPMDAERAVQVALTGDDHAIDVGRMADGTVFAVMAGAGFDASMMREAPEGLKDAVGWPAYLIGAARSMRRDRVSVRLRLDGGAVTSGRVRTVLIGNVGRLQGGLELLPDARPDDGRLDVCLVCPRRAIDWVVLLGRAVTRRHRPDQRLRTFSATRIEVRLMRPQPRQVDGDLIASGDRLDAEVVPGALILRVPPQDPPPQDPEPAP